MRASRARKESGLSLTTETFGLAQLGCGADFEQVVMAENVAVVFLVSSLVEDFNLRRIERYLVLAWESGAQPVVVLTKADLCDDVDGSVEEVESIAIGVPVHAVSNVTGEGIEELRPYFAGNRTAGA